MIIFLLRSTETTQVIKSAENAAQISVHVNKLAEKLRVNVSEIETKILLTTKDTQYAQVVLDTLNHLYPPPPDIRPCIKHTENVRKKMSDSKAGNKWNTGRKWTAEKRAKINAIRTVTPPNMKMTIKQVQEIRRLVTSPDIHHQLRDVVGIKMKNGKRMSLKQAFAQHYHHTYGTSVINILNIIDRKTWKHV